MQAKEIFHVAVLPPPSLEQDLVKKVAAITNREIYGTRLGLAGKLPRVLAHFDTQEKADSTANNLRAAGLVTMVCRDSELRRIPVCFGGYSIKFDDNGILLLDKKGSSVPIGIKDVCLVIEGRLQTSISKQVTNTRMKLNLPATVMTGGIPILRRVSEKSEEKTVETESFIRIYNRTLPEPVAEIRQHDFDYSSPGREISPSSLINFRNLVKKLREIFIDANFDSRLAEPSRADIPTDSPRECIEINSRLIYQFLQASSGHTPVK